MSIFYNSKRLGRFIIDANNIRHNRKMIYNIMALVIPIEASMHTTEDSLEYLAISENFDELDSDEMIPLYNFQMNGNDEFQKVIRMPASISQSKDVSKDVLELVDTHNINITDFRNWAVMKGITDNGLKNRNFEYLEFLKLYVDKVLTKL